MYLKGNLVFIDYRRGLPAVPKHISVLLFTKSSHSCFDSRTRSHARAHSPGCVDVWWLCPAVNIWSIADNADGLLMLNLYHKTSMDMICVPLIPLSAVVCCVWHCLAVLLCSMPSRAMILLTLAAAAAWYQWLTSLLLLQYYVHL